jgi:hypothetical protein
MENIKDAGHAVSEKVKGNKEIYHQTKSLFFFFSLVEVASGSSYEANKAAAKNDNLSAGSRIGHGVDAVQDKGITFFFSLLSKQISILFF